MALASLLGCTAMIPMPLLAQEAPQNSFSLKVLGYNIWNKKLDSHFWDPAAKALKQLKFRDEMKTLIDKVKPNVVALPELNNNREMPPKGWLPQQVSTSIINEMLAAMNAANAGDLGYVAASTNAGIDGTGGDVFSTLPMQDTGKHNTVVLNPTNGFPKTYFTSSHLCYFDKASDLCDDGSSRIAGAKVYNQEAAERILPTILAGDFNAGDVSERGLQRASQQELILRGAADGKAFYPELARQYAQMAAAAGKIGTPTYVDAYIKVGKREAPITADIFVDETYPVGDNVPQTMNILKQEYEMIQQLGDQEPFKPHNSANDGSSTWTTLGHEETNNWPSWDHVKIDHIMASRPFAKWIITDPNDPRTGVLYSFGDFKDGKNSMSDHQPYAQNLIWAGPQVEAYRDGNTNKTRLIWGKDASKFAERGGTFDLTRNNMRSDMFLGQLSDANGIPFYAPLRPVQEDLGVLLAYAVNAGGNVDQAGSRATLRNYVEPEQRALYDDYLDKLSAEGTTSFYKTVIQSYFGAHGSEFPGISRIGGMSWEQWGNILIKTLKAGGLTFSNVDLRVAGALEELSTALGLDDPAIRQQYAARYGLDFDRDRNAALKIPLDCGNVGMLSLKGARASCIDRHDFIGETLVKDKGTIVIEEDVVLGESDDRLRLDDGRLLVKGTVMTDLDREISLEGAGGNIYVSEVSNSLTAKQKLGGDGALTKDGKGTLVLNAVNDYKGGTVVKSGTLKAAVAGAFVDKTPYAVDTGATLDLNGFNLTASGLRGNGAVALGAATLTLDLSSDSRFDGVIGGSGNLIKSGMGRQTLTGDSSGFAGSTAVQGGALSVNGKLGGTVVVHGNGRLQGTGTLSGLSVGSGGTTAPGNSIGTLNVAGGVSFAAGSTYEVEVNAAGASDRIAATGKVSIAGGTIKVLAEGGNYAWQTGYTILTAADGRIGNFDGVTSNLAFLTPLLGYDTNNVYLRLTRNDVDFASIGATVNQGSTGRAVERLGRGNPVFDAIIQSDVSGARTAFDSLSGEINASTVAGLIEDTRLTRDAINDRLRSAFETVGVKPLVLMGYGDDAGEITASVPGELHGVWSSAFGSRGSTDSDGNAGRLSRSTGGFVTGVDGFITNDWRLGFLAGYSQSSFNYDERKSSASSDNYHLGLYGGRQLGALSFRSGLAYTWSEIDSSRQVSVPGFDDGLSGSHRAETTQVFGEVGYGMKAGAIALEPFANLAYVNVHDNGFTEKGGAAALTVQGGSNAVTFTTLGVRAATDFDLGAMKTTARGMLGWRHGFGDVDPAVAHAFSGSNTFTISGAPISPDSAIIEAGLDFAIAPQATLGVSYHGQLGSETREHGVRADLSVRF